MTINEKKLGGSTLKSLRDRGVVTMKNTWIFKLRRWKGKTMREQTVKEIFFHRCKDKARKRWARILNRSKKNTQREEEVRRKRPTAAPKGRRGSVKMGKQQDDAVWRRERKEENNLWPRTALLCWDQNQDTDGLAGTQVQTANVCVHVCEGNEEKGGSRPRLEELRISRGGSQKDRWIDG